MRSALPPPGRPRLRLAAPAPPRTRTRARLGRSRRKGRGGGGRRREERGHPRAPGCIVGRRRQRPGRAGGAPAAVAAVNPPGRLQHCGAASPARPRTAAPLLPLAAFPPARPSPPRGAPAFAGAARPGRPAGLPSPAPTGGRAALRRRGGERRAGPRAGGRRCRTSARPPTARGRARSRTWPSSGSRGTRPGERPAPSGQPGLPLRVPGREGRVGGGGRRRRRPQPRTPPENGPRAGAARAAGGLGARAPPGVRGPGHRPEREAAGAAAGRSEGALAPVGSLCDFGPVAFFSGLPSPQLSKEGRHRALSSSWHNPPPRGSVSGRIESGHLL